MTVTTIFLPRIDHHFFHFWPQKNYSLNRDEPSWQTRLSKVTLYISYHLDTDVTERPTQAGGYASRGYNQLTHCTSLV